MQLRSFRNALVVRAQAVEVVNFNNSATAGCRRRPCCPWHGRHCHCRCCRSHCPRLKLPSSPFLLRHPCPFSAPSSAASPSSPLSGPAFRLGPLRRSYERLSPLHASHRAIDDLSALSPGDCLVAFSRRRLHRLKHDVEVASGGRTRCAVVYGGLPPDVRREQARLFNERGTSGFDVLVASDAIGMGLNLSISRVIFSGLEKFDGRCRRLLEPHEVKQIAGRAGRFGGPFDQGFVTCMQQRDMAHLRDGMAAPEEDLAAAGLFPTLEQLVMFARAMGGYDSLARDRRSHRRRGGSRNGGDNKETARRPLRLSQV
ncbi:unnamed protein product, partial [Phaeothamnion confervicola]